MGAASKARVATKITALPEGGYLARTGSGLAIRTGPRGAKVKIISNGNKIKSLTGGISVGEEIPLYIGGDDVVGGAKNVVGSEQYKEVLKVTEEANPLVDSLRETGELPDNFVTKDVASQNGWSPGKAIDNYVPGGQLGGDVFENIDDLLPPGNGRVWYEADVVSTGNMSRAKQAGSRLLYSDDGLMYIMTDHYNTFHYIGRY